MVFYFGFVMVNNTPKNDKLKVMSFGLLCTFVYDGTIIHYNLIEDKLITRED